MPKPPGGPQRRSPDPTDTFRSPKGYGTAPLLEEISGLFTGAPGSPPPLFVRTLQMVAVFSMGYCGNDYTVNGKNNLLTYSEEFDNAAWINDTTFVVPNVATAPDGTLTADRLVTGQVSDKSIRQQVELGSAAALRTFVGSVYAKNEAIDRSIMLQIDQVGGSTFQNTIMVRKSDDWTRLTFIVTFAVGDVGTQVRLVIQPSGKGETILWGAQFEEADHAGRYQKTTSTPAEVSTCEAVDAGDGARCFFALQTCPDPEHFDGQTTPTARALFSPGRKWAFCMKEGYSITTAQLPGSLSMVRPYMIGLDFLSQKIDPTRSVTESSRLTLRMHDDMGAAFFDYSKPLANTKNEGSFWQAWVQRYRNFSYRRVEIWLVPSGAVIEDLSSSYRLFTGVIEDISFNASGTINIICKDLLKKARTRVPAAISADNVTITALAASGGVGVTLDVIRANEFTDLTSLVALAGATASKVAIRIGSSSPEKDEVMIVTARDTIISRLTIDRAQFGSAAQAHPAGSQIREIIVYRNTVSPYAGFNPIDIEFDLLMRSGIAAADSNQASFTNDRDVWLTDKPMSRIVEQPEDVETLLREIKQTIFSSIFTDEDQKVVHRLLAPAGALLSLPLLSDVGSFVEKTPQVEIKDPTRINRAILFYDPVDFEAGTEDIKSFRRRVYVEDGDATDPRNYGKTTPPLQVYSKWFAMGNAGGLTPSGGDEASAFFFAKKVVAVNKNGMTQFIFDLDLKDASIRVGDSFVADSDSIVDAWGNRVLTEMFVMEKKRISLSRFHYTALSMKDKPKYGLIAPRGTPNYLNSTIDQRQRFVYIGDKNNKVGNGTTEGYLAW